MDFLDATHEFAHIVASAAAAKSMGIGLDRITVHVLDGPAVAFEVTDAPKSTVDRLHGLAGVGPIATDQSDAAMRADLKGNMAKSAVLSELDKAALTTGACDQTQLRDTVLAVKFYDATDATVSKFNELAEHPIAKERGLPLAALIDEKKLQRAQARAADEIFALDCDKPWGSRLKLEA